jgi:hypothetical protein
MMRSGTERLTHRNGTEIRFILHLKRAAVVNIPQFTKVRWNDIE